MKINFIYGNITPNISIDIEVLRLALKKCKDKIELKSVNVMDYKCDDAILNVFFNYANLSFLNKAKGNIIILEHTCFQKEWIEYLPLFDLAFVKTDYSYEVFKSHLKDRGLPYDNLRPTLAHL